MELEVRSIPSVLAELGHDHIDLLMLSVEGSEYELIEAILREGIPVGVLCVEFAQPTPLRRVEGTLARLREAGWRLAHSEVRPYFWKLTLVSEG